MTCMVSRVVGVYVFKLSLQTKSKAACVFQVSQSALPCSVHIPKAAMPVCPIQLKSPKSPYEFNERWIGGRWFADNK